MKEYKVFTEKDQCLSGKFDPEKLEQIINSYAKEGWAVVSIATASIRGLSRDEIIVVMEREK
ncbi:MAG: DUF4177 domain-containing protein [bacterium]